MDVGSAFSDHALLFGGEHYGVTAGLPSPSSPRSPRSRSPYRTGNLATSSERQNYVSLRQLVADVRGESYASSEPAATSDIDLHRRLAALQLRSTPGAWGFVRCQPQSPEVTPPLARQPEIYVPGEVAPRDGRLPRLWDWQVAFEAPICLQVILQSCMSLAMLISWSPSGRSVVAMAGDPGDNWAPGLSNFKVYARISYGRTIRFALLIQHDLSCLFDIFSVMRNVPWAVDSSSQSLYLELVFELFGRELDAEVRKRSAADTVGGHLPMFTGGTVWAFGDEDTALRTRIVQELDAMTVELLNDRDFQTPEFLPRRMGASYLGVDG